MKGWSHSQRSGIWWFHSFEKLGASEITECHLGNLVSLTDHCDLFFVCEVDIRSHLINETPCGPYHTWGLIVRKPGREDPPQLGGLLRSPPPPLSGGPLPWALPRNWDELRDGTLTCLAGVTSIAYKCEWNPIPSDPLSLSSLPSPSVRWEDPHGPGHWPCTPSDFEIGDSHFKADYYYSLRKSWEWGCFFSQTFLLAFSCLCLTSLFSHNGKFSIPSLKIYSSKMPSPKPKSLGLPRGDKTRKTYLLF